MSRLSARQVLATAGVLGAMALVVLDAGMINVALPTIAAAVEVSSGESILVASAYQLALLIGLLPAAHVAERTGYRGLFAGGAGLFIAASAAAAFAPGFAWLVAARFVQGIGGAAILALGIALLRAALGSERLHSAIAWNALNVALCAAAAPAIGALVLTAADWSWLFLVNMPLGLVVLAMVPSLPKVAPTRGFLDGPGMLLYAICAALLALSIHWLPIAFAPAILLAALGVVGALVLVRNQARKRLPVVPVDLFRDRGFGLAVAASACCFVAQCAGLIALPFHLQLRLASSALETGLTMACWPLATAATSRFADRLTTRHGPSPVCATGAALLSVGLVGASLAPAMAGALPIALCAALCGIGFGLFQVPNNRILFFAAAEDRSAAAGAVQGTARLTGQISGSLIVALLFASTTAVAAPRTAIAAAALFGVVAVVLSVRRARSGEPSQSLCQARGV